MYVCVRARARARAGTTHYRHLTQSQLPSKVHLVTGVVSATGHLMSGRFVSRNVSNCEHESCTRTCCGCQGVGASAMRRTLSFD